VYGTYWNQALSAGRGSVLVDSCLERGYQPGIYFSAALTSPEFDRTIFSKVPGMTLKRNGKTKLERDYEAIDDFKAFVKKRDKSKPTFAVFMYDSLHGYMVPDNFKVPFPNAYKAMNYLTLKKNDKAQQQKVFNLIRNASAFIDVQLEDMMEFLKKEYDWENTIFIISSDHGNEANESGNNIWGHNSKFSRYQLHVPLIIAGGPIRKGKFDHRTYHIDVVPTLMKILGCTSPVSDYSTGRWIWETSDRDLMIFASYSNRAMLYDDKIYEMNRNGATYSYDLKGRNIKSRPSGKLTKKFLDEISRFSR
jgi:membrane-anchored protein YejM (alkaline phosphatase superfamily)